MKTMNLVNKLMFTDILGNFRFKSAWPNNFLPISPLQTFGFKSYNVRYDIHFTSLTSMLAFY